MSSVPDNFNVEHIEPPLAIEVAGQRLTLFFNTETQIEAVLNDIRSAQSRVWLETYIFLEDRIGRLVAEALKERASAGVEVRIHYDAVGSLATPNSFFRDLALAGAKLHCFRSAWEALSRFSFFKTYNRRNHRKLLVIDDRVAYFGGMNIVDHASETATDSPKRSHTAIGWRDVHVRLEGRQQRHVAESFELSWQRAQGQPSRPSATNLPLGVLLARDRQTSLPQPADSLESSALATNNTPADNAPSKNKDEWVRFFDSGPGPRSHRAARVFTRLMQAARFRLTFSMAYFLPVGQVRRTLFQSAQRGVRVRVVLPSFSDMPFIQRATRYFYDVLLRRRCEVFERQQRMLHSKVLIMDDEYVVLGSSNFDVRSLWINWEFVVVIRSRRLAALMTEVVSREAQESVRVTQSFWRNQSWWQRLLDRIAWSLRLWL